MTDAPKLKPCPFCGSRAVYHRANPVWHRDAMWNAACGFGCASSVDLPSKKEAAEWWNRRKRAKAKERKADA